MTRLMAAPILLALAAPVFAQGEFRDARVRYLEPGVLLQRAGEYEAEEAVANLPFLPGDRLWTDATGRAELQFEGRSRVRLDSRGKLDYLSHDSGRRNDRILLKLWSGGLYFYVADGSYFPDFELETPGGLVEFLERGVYRVDAEAGETRLTVYEGQATLDSGGRRVHVASGERTYARREQEPERPRPFDAQADLDEFALWDRDREDALAWAGNSERYLPEDVGHYAGELEEAGSWYYEAEVGHVWRPYVSAGWRPYANGHWVWTYYGWTWVPYEPWGWVTFHYGRWGYSPVLGWYWIPGYVWGPAWVSWAVGGDYIGWCALGYRDRPVIVRETSRAKGYAVPRGTAPQPSAVAAPAPAADPVEGFLFARKSDMGTRLVSQRRFAITADAARGVRVVDSLEIVPDKDLKLGPAVTASEAAARTIKTRRTFGDNVPELQADPTTTIPLRSWVRDRERVEERRHDTRPEAGERPTDLRSPRVPTVRERGSDTPRWRSRPESEGRPTDLRSPRTPIVRTPDGDAPRRILPQADERRPRPVSPPSERGDRPSWAPRETPYEPQLREREVEPRREPDRDVLRRFFKPLSEGRTPSEGSDRRSAPRSEPRSLAPPRAEAPKLTTPAPPAPPKPQIQRARPKKEKDN